MSKLNSRGQNHVPQGMSHKGVSQELKSHNQQLFEIVVSTMYNGNQNSFYEKTDETVHRLIRSIHTCVKHDEFDFVANTIYFARTDMHIRTMPIIATVQFAGALRLENKTYPNMRQLVCDVIQRADQITDLYAYALTVFGDKKKIPTAIKRGCADAFNKFNEYALAKYNRVGGLTMSDALRIVHPKPKDPKQGMLFQKVIEDKLETPYTWETQLSALGADHAEEMKEQGIAKENSRYVSLLNEKKKKVWTELLESNKLGIMALLRNLRNMTECGVTTDVMQRCVYSRLRDADEIARSKQLPFRFLSALDNVPNRSNGLTSALNAAIDLSLGNVGSIGENVWIILDMSASMGGFGYGFNHRASSNQKRPIEHAALFAAALIKAHSNSNNIRLTMFGNDAFFVDVNCADSIPTIAEKLRSKVRGGGTNLRAALNLKNQLGFEPDTVVLLSDGQVNDCIRSGNDIMKRILPKGCTKVSFNFASLATTPTGEKDGWYQISGWSDKVFDLIPTIKNTESITAKLSVPYREYDM